jgi:hypothetical protein
MDHVASGDQVWRSDGRRWTMELMAMLLVLIVLLLVVKIE